MKSAGRLTKVQRPDQKAAIGLDWVFSTTVNTRFWETKAAIETFLGRASQDVGFVLTELPRLAGEDGRSSVRMTYPGWPIPYWLVYQWFKRPGSKFYAAIAYVGIGWNAPK